MISSTLQKYVESGHWVAGELAGHLLKQLSKNQPSLHREPGLTSRCISHYRRLKLDDIKLQSDSKGLSDLEISVGAEKAVNDIFNRELENASLAQGFTVEESKKLTSALELIRSLDPQVFSILSKVVGLFIKAENVQFRSASHPHLMGTIILSEKAFKQDTNGLAVSVVHELAHQELYFLNLMDRLVVKAFDYNQIHAPFQDRKRPPIGRLHSMWALYRMVQFERKIGVPVQKHEDLLRRNCIAFELPELTEFGKFLVAVTAKQVA